MGSLPDSLQLGFLLARIQIMKSFFKGLYFLWGPSRLTLHWLWTDSAA
jgi:hypothetical protein